MYVTKIAPRSDHVHSTNNTCSIRCITNTTRVHHADTGCRQKFWTCSKFFSWLATSTTCSGCVTMYVELITRLVRAKHDITRACRRCQSTLYIVFNIAKVGGRKIKLILTKHRLTSINLKLTTTNLKLTPTKLKLTTTNLKLTTTNLKLTTTNLKLTPTKLKLTPWHIRKWHVENLCQKVKLLIPGIDISVMSEVCGSVILWNWSCALLHPVV